MLDTRRYPPEIAIRRIYEFLKGKPEEEALDPRWKDIWEKYERYARRVASLPIIEETEEILQSIKLVDEDIWKIKIDKNTKITFLLGAGASAPSGIPTVDKLLSELWKRARKIGREDLDRLAKWCTERGISNIEDLLTAAYISNFAARNPNITALLDYFIFSGGKELNIEDLYIDLGATSKKEVEECGIEIGDYAFFTSKFRISKQNIIGKAFDDRIGCFLLIKLLKEIEDFKGTIYATFTVQEEVGLRGAGVAAFSIEPDVAIVLEGTVASDTPDTPPYKAITFLNKGPAIRVLDATMITHRKLLKFVKNIAREKGIPYQLQISPRSGTDAGRIHITKSGIPSVVISVPCRYIHSPHCIAKINDLENTFKLLLEVSKRMNEFTTEL